MSNRAQITQQAARDGVSAPTVERDYVLAHLIAGLGALSNDHGLVFKGGTALRMCYFNDYRYSADLDFSLVEGDLESAYGTVEAAFAAVTGAVDTLALSDEEPRRIAYQGPLGRQRFLKLDIAVDELVRNADSIGLLPQWPGLPETAQGEQASIPVADIERKLDNDFFAVPLLSGYIRRQHPVA